MITIENDFFECNYDIYGKTISDFWIKRANADSDTFDMNAFKELSDVAAIEKIKGSKPCCALNTYVPIETLILPEKMKWVAPCSFVSLPIKTVVWPSSCEVIPEYVFEGSNIEHLENIGHVSCIEKGAFYLSRISSFDVPAKVELIPANCFTDSKLSQITGIEHINEIAEFAFESTKLTEFNFSKCSIIRQGAFKNCRQLKSISGLERILKIEQAAFYKTRIEVLDLCSSVCGEIWDYAFANSNLQKFIPGFYLQMVSPSAFKGTKVGRSKKEKEEK